MQIEPGLGVVLTTGFCGVITNETARELGFRGLLVKPTTARLLAELKHRLAKTDAIIIGDYGKGVVTQPL